MVDRKPSEGRKELRARCEDDLYEFWAAQPDKEELLRQLVRDERDRRLNT